MKHLIAIITLLASVSVSAETLYDCKSTEGNGVVMILDGTLFDDIQRLMADQTAPGVFVGEDTVSSIKYTFHGDNITVTGKRTTTEYTCKLSK